MPHTCSPIASLKDYGSGGQLAQAAQQLFQLAVAGDLDIDVAAPGYLP
jgi:hypothetical protein